MGNLYLDSAAEREATDVGKRFMNSNDVVGDMSRAYNTDLSSVRIHTDSTAASMAANRGVDAFSTGRDIFFGDGVFNCGDPAGRGLLAHELSHSIQQGIGGSDAMTYSAPMGAEQGGFLDWFTGLFKKKKSAAPRKTREERELEAAKKRRLDSFDAEDAKAESWKSESSAQSELAYTAMERGYDGNPIREATTDADYADVNLSDLLRQAREIGWKREGTVNKEIDFDMDLIENFFREASGEGLLDRENNNGVRSRNKGVYTGRRSLQEMMDVFNGHSEEATLEFIKPLMQFSPREFAERFPLQDMTPEERLSVYPELTKESDRLIGIKQWAEKYGVTTLSKENRDKLDSQIECFMRTTNWYLGLYIPGQPSSISQIYEQDIKNLNGENVKHYESGYLKSRNEGVMKELGLNGDEMSFDEFERYAGSLMIPNGDKDRKIFVLAKEMPGLSYNKETDTVVCPIPKSDLKALSKGNMKVLNKYAKKMKSMSWREESGRVRRAGMYESSDDEFDANYENDMKYFGDMATTALMLKKFGTDKFFEKQAKNGEYQDLSDRIKLAQSTNAMMKMRGDALGSMHHFLYNLQFGDSGVKPTWIKRQLFETESNFTNTEKEQRLTGKELEGKTISRSYFSNQSQAVAKMLMEAKAHNPELLKDPKMVELVMQTFDNGFVENLKKYDNNQVGTLESNIFRNSESGELYDYNVILSAHSNDIVDRLGELGKDREVTAELVDQCLNEICDFVTQPGNPIFNMLMHEARALPKSKHYKNDPQKVAYYTMNNYVLRCICPPLQIQKKCGALSKALMAAASTGESAAAVRLKTLFMPMIQ